MTYRAGFADFFQLRLLPSRFGALNGFRAIAVIYIVVDHASWWLSTSATFTMRRGWASVDFLFVLTGFLAGRILLNEQSSRSKIGFWRYYFRRSLRIFPPYYFTLVVAFAIKHHAHYPFSWKEAFFLTNYPFSAQYLMPWSWTLSADEHFYLIMPILIWALTKLRARGQFVLLTTLFLIPLGLRLLFVDNADNFFRKIYCPSHTRFDTLVMGVMVALILHRYSSQMHEFFSRRLIAPLFLVIATTALASTFYFRLPVGHLGLKEVYQWLLPAVFLMGTVSSVGFFFLFFWMIYADNLFIRLLSSKTMRILATLSYGIYLIHVFPLSFVGKWHPTASFGGWIFNTVLALLISGTYAYLLHIMVEKPFLAFRDHWDARRRALQPPGVAQPQL